jgi:hypothetical protein
MMAAAFPGVGVTQSNLFSRVDLERKHSSFDADVAAGRRDAQSGSRRHDDDRLDEAQLLQVAEASRIRHLLFIERE